MRPSGSPQALLSSTISYLTLLLRQSTASKPSVAEWLGVSTWCLWSRVRCPLTGKGPMPSHLTGRLLSHWCEFVACHIRVDEIVEKRGGFGPLDLHSLFAWCNPVSSRYFPPQNLLNAGVRSEARVQGTRPLAKAPALAPERGLQYSICLTFLPLWWG